MSDPSVSIIIPAFNRCDSILASVASVLAQTFTNFEIVVVDDGSTDGTFEIARSINDDRVKVFRLEDNVGVSAARNFGVAQSLGRWIAFHDSDDFWLPHKLERQIGALQDSETSSDPIAVFCGMVIVSESPKSGDINVKNIPQSYVKPLSVDFRSQVLRDSFISTQTLLVRRDVFISIGGFDDKLRALVDWDLVIRLSGFGPVALVKMPLVVQYFSPNSITNNKERRVLAQEYIFNKYRATISADKAALRIMYRRLSGGFFQLGNFQKSSHYSSAGLFSIASSPVFLIHFLRARLYGFFRAFRGT